MVKSNYLHNNNNKVHPVEADCDDSESDDSTNDDFDIDNQYLNDEEHGRGCRYFCRNNILKFFQRIKYELSVIQLKEKVRWFLKSAAFDCRISVS